MCGPVAISTYHEYILEAITALRLGLNYFKQYQNLDEASMSDNSGYFAAMNCRYAFIMVANSIEAAANALLLSREFQNSYYEELEKLNTLLKFKLFCNLIGKNLDYSDARYSHVKDIISCRNEFVNPKPRKTTYTVENSTSSIVFDIKKTKNRQYPFYFSDILPQHALTALEDALSFLSWVCFDICGYEIKEGALLLGINSYSSSAEIDLIGMEYNIKFDTRTFGRLI